MLSANNSYQRGFTMLEVLFVLSVWSIILLLSAPLYFPIMDKYEENNFISTFEMDLLYMQSQSYGSTSYYRMSFPDSRSYEIRKDFHEIVRERTVPKHWHIEGRTLPVISFNKTGTITQPGSFNIITGASEYTVVCPLGKGRCYFEEQ
ncbi:competence type IV pilus minor pilin ComGD [Virgibacillus kekensis]|uniref:Competence type IV pilus minor pilin ComGD n=1 Tax=Virgibacillus kekensis TaxID=202261 RepID=A0ABV9DKV3_9BACI